MKGLVSGNHACVPQHRVRTYNIIIFWNKSKEGDGTFTESLQPTRQWRRNNKIVMKIKAQLVFKDGSLRTSILVQGTIGADDPVCPLKIIIYTRLKV